MGSHADVIANMFDNISKCLMDNAALLREIHKRAQSGALPGPSAVENKPSAAKRKHGAAEKPKPKRTLTSYQIWMAAKREELKELHSELAPTELMAELGRQWKLLGDADKAQYVEKAAQLKRESGVTVLTHALKLLRRRLISLPRSPP